MAVTSAAAVANEFIKLAEAEPEHEFTHLKLQKLLYFAYAWFVGATKQPLFDEDIEAWQYGPVVTAIYEQFKHCGSDRIHGRARVIAVSDGVVEDQPAIIEDDRLKQFIRKIWDAYKALSGLQLSAATHAPDEAWQKVWSAAGGRRTPIPMEVIERIYRPKVEKSRIKQQVAS